MQTKTKGELTRDRVLDAATRLIQRQGYAGTGLKQVLEESGSPRGSLYFHFPGGKEQLAAEVVRRHADEFEAKLRSAVDAAPSASAALHIAIDVLGQEVETSGCDAGCPTTAIASEMSGRSETLRLAAVSAFERWRRVIAEKLVTDGLPAADAEDRALAVLGAIEGALVLCRAYQSRRPLDSVGATFELCLDQ